RASVPREVPARLRRARIAHARLQRFSLRSQRKPMSLPADVAPQTTRVGLVGVGNMGAPMATNLLKAGWRVTVYDAQPEKAKAFTAEHGGAAASSLTEMGKSCDVV